ncbi:hypothetical protein AB0F72_13700 [Actinoplanes sp. NPDC023936]|uniref:hypothetical protein n=1 Tax=Actinoplanes sp. NPDC023936 TaxID=3154910 RepID=UPI0033E41AAA
MIDDGGLGRIGGRRLNRVNTGSRAAVFGTLRKVTSLAFATFQRRLGVFLAPKEVAES